MLGQLGNTFCPPGLTPSRPARRWQRGTRHGGGSTHATRAALGDTSISPALQRQLDQLLQQQEQATTGLGGLGLGASGVSSGLAERLGSVGQVAEGLKATAAQPHEAHWGTKLLTSAVEKWAAALSQYVDAASTSGGLPVEQARAALEQLRAALPQLPQQLAASGGAGEQLGSTAADLQGALDGLVQSALSLQQALTAAASGQASSLAAAAPQLQLPSALPPLSALPAALPASPGLALGVGALAGAAAVLAATRRPPPPGGSGGSGPSGSGRGGAGPSGQYLPSTYNAEEVGAYFEARPVLVASRAAEVAAQAAQVGAALLLDQATGGLEANSWERAAQVRSVIERLGPAYVKVAQALSTRVDILSPPYLMEIERLQDRVPTFDDAVAMRMIAQAYGRPVEAVFSRITPSSVAAASLGQVYRGVLRPELGGQEVAVKVRRPGVLEAVALDLYLMRQFALYLRTLPQVKSDWVGIIDKWAEAFFAEMDYEMEAENARRFKRDMEEKELSGIVVPDVLMCTSEVLVTQWIEGEKLCESTASDVRELCNTLLSAYLIQLLETGFLHADPHPGNLLRTPDGKIAILDFGLMTTVPPDYSLALVEYIAHLSVGDYEAIVEDLVKLGFMPEGGDKEGLVEPLGILLEQLTAGGGAANVNIEVVSAEIDKLANRYPFQVPPYFALILRSFSVIEGIALRVDPQYAIVSECFPYLTRRLLTDNHPRARQALRELLFGEGQHIDLERLQRMVDGFGQYTVAGLTDVPHRRLPAGAGEEVAVVAVDGPGGQPAADVVVDVAGDRRPLLSPAAKEALLVLFSREGNYAQELLVGQAVATVDAASRELAARAVGSLLGSAPALAGLSAIEALGPWRSLLLPVPTPLELLNRVAPVLQPSEDDVQALATARGVVDLVQRAPMPLPGPPTPSDAVRLAQEVAPLLPELLPGVAKTGELFGKQLVRRVALRVAADMQLGVSAEGASRGSAPDL